MIVARFTLGIIVASAAWFATRWAEQRIRATIRRHRTRQ